MLYVLRHGQVETNVKDQINGWNEENLTELGVQQAREAGKKLQGVDFAAVYCSPLLRARQTYENLGRADQEVFYDDRLKERFSGKMTFHQATEVNMDLWYAPEKEVIYEDTEGFGKMLKRARSVLAEIREKYGDENVLVVTHGDVCKAIRLCFEPEVKDIGERDQGNCEVARYSW